jgi:hypothetical protein
MIRMIANWRLQAAVMARTTVVVALLLGATGLAFGQPRLEGAWGVVTQERNCTTNAAIGPPTRALVSYHAGGSVSESRYIPVFCPRTAIGGSRNLESRWACTGRVVTMIQFDSAPKHAAGLAGLSGWLAGGDSEHYVVGSGQLHHDRHQSVLQCQSRDLQGRVRVAGR